MTDQRRPLAVVTLGSLIFALAVGGGIFAFSGEAVRPAGATIAPPVAMPLVPSPTMAASGRRTAATPSANPTARPSRDLTAGTAPRSRQRASTMTRSTPPPAPTARPAPAATAVPVPRPVVPAPAPPVSGGTAVGPSHRVATRVVVPALGIDLPVMPQRTSYPACNVAMYLAELSQPGRGGPTYLYAHARAGMFLSLLTQSQIADGANMLGMQAHVYTGDNRVFTYQIDEVRRHTTDLAAVFARGSESLWLQTSEGPRGTIPKLQVGAHLVSSGSASHAASHPVPRPVPC